MKNDKCVRVGVTNFGKDREKNQGKVQFNGIGSYVDRCTDFLKIK